MIDSQILRRLENIALKADRGPWRLSDNPHGTPYVLGISPVQADKEDVVANTSMSDRPKGNDRQNMAYIAEFSPNTVLELIARIRELEGRNQPSGWQVLPPEGVRDDICAYASEQQAREMAAPDEIVRPFYTNSNPQGEDETKAREALLGLVQAWEKLEGGRSYAPSEMENWLMRDVAPAVGVIRRVLNLPEPSR